jgi:ERCC4-type nuclease
MNIIIDTREQKPLRFTGHETVRRKLDEGDYNIEELIPYIVIERKSLNDFYSTLTSGHERFKREILRSKQPNISCQEKKFYIFLEGHLEDLQQWGMRGYLIIEKIINTMIERYKIILVECVDRESMSRQIVRTIENELKQAKVE